MSEKVISLGSTAGRAGARKMVSTADEALVGSTRVLLREIGVRVP